MKKTEKKKKTNSWHEKIVFDLCSDRSRLVFPEWCFVSTVAGCRSMAGTAGCGSTVAGCRLKA